jgi:hypothetical protein
VCTEQNRNFCSALLSSCVFPIGADRDLVHASQAATVPGASRSPVPGASAAVPGDHGDLVCALLGRKMSRRRTGKKSRRRAASPCRPRACPPSRPTTTRKNRCTRGSAPAPGSRRARQVFRTALATTASRDSLRCFFSNSGRGRRPRIGLPRALGAPVTPHTHVPGGEAGLRGAPPCPEDSDALGELLPDSLHAAPALPSGLHTEPAPPPLSVPCTAPRRAST